MILTTGASGFVGSAVANRLAVMYPGQSRAAVRNASARLSPDVRQALVEDLSSSTGWAAALEDAEAVVHAAARVHILRDRASDPLTEFRRANVDGTLRLARLAVESSVKRFVFISSIKVNGEETSPGRPYSATDAPAPVDPYGISKDEAERGLRAIARETGLEVVVVRPVLVYGPGVKGNFRLLVRCLKRGLPLPLGAVDNRRSLVALDNLVDLVVRCVSHPAAANQTFLVSDGEDMSTTALLRRTAAALGKPARLLPVPATILRAAAAVTGHREAARRLLGSLQVDITATCSRLDWSPPISVDEGLRRAVAGE